MFDDGVEADPSIREVDSDEPFRILILGDFSGRANRGLHAALAGRRPTPIDLDNFDEVLEQMQTGLRLPGVELRFRELDDFHPDHIYRAADIFQNLDRLSAEPEAPAAPVPARAPLPSGAGLLDSILGEAEAAPLEEADVEEGGDLAAFIRKAMAPHLEERPDPRQLSKAAREQAAATSYMRALLHHGDFQALEAAWRAVWMLVQGLADDVKIYLLDATLDELLGDAATLEKVLTGARNPWALVVGNFAFEESEADARRLAVLGRMAGAAGAPLLAEAQPPSSATAPKYWQELRQSPAAQWLGLAVPRFLLRLPYGKATSAIEAFPFEEMTGSVHTEYLWGNPAFCCAYLIGQAFRTQGWNLLPGMHRQMEGLPLHVYKDGPETVNKPCAEVLLSEKQAEWLMERGYIPLASMKNQDAVRVVRFQSIAEPLAPLGGRWAG